MNMLPIIEEKIVLGDDLRNGGIASSKISTVGISLFSCIFSL